MGGKEEKNEDENRKVILILNVKYLKIEKENLVLYEMEIKEEILYSYICCLVSIEEKL